MYYSKATNGFYDKDIHGENIPADAVAITAEKHAELLAGQATGKVIAADSNGNPVLKSAPVFPPQVPAKVSRFQARRALKDAGRFAEVEAAIAQSDEFTQDAWADAQEFQRDSEMILTLGAALSLDLDALFLAAAKIEA